MGCPISPSFPLLLLSFPAQNPPVYFLPFPPCDCAQARNWGRGSGGSYEPPYTRSPGPLYDRPSDDSQHSSQATQQDRVSHVHVLLRIACTIPVTSCECEIANSLRRLQTFTLLSMALDRLSSLALIHTFIRPMIWKLIWTKWFLSKNHADCNSQIFCVTGVLCSTLESAKGSLTVSSCYTFESCTLGL